MKLKGLKPIGIPLSIKHLYVISWTIAIVVSGYTIYFINKNFYETVAQIKIIEPLKEEVAPDIIDIKRVDRVLESINNKIHPTSTPPLNTLENPFIQLSITNEDVTEIDNDGSILEQPNTN